MNERMVPVAFGVGAGLVQFFVPEGLGVIVVILAAFAAGWSLQDEPMAAALLFLSPAVVLGGLRVLLDADTAPFGTLAFGAIVAVMFTAFFTHIGAGVAHRRHRADRS